MRKSIRWRLAASFAGIALLATLTLGAVLLTIVRGFYARQEREYLEENARSLALLFGTVVQTSSSPDMIQTQVENLSFLSQSRIRLLDADGQVLADSMAPTSRQIISLDQGAVTTLQRTVSATLPATDDVVFIAADDDPLSSQPMYAYESVVVRKSDSALTDTPIGFRFIAAGGPYGFSLNEQVDLSAQRSRYQVKQPVETVEGTPWGTLELSEGPAYGTQIVRNVARGWGLASVVAVLLSACVGWWASRSISAPLLHLVQATVRMSENDLSARAPDTGRQDELGTLARAFNEMAQRVEEMVNTLRTFVTDAAHEIHTPLATIRTNLDLLSTNDAVSRAQTQVARLEALTADLLDLSRIEAGKVDAQQEPVDIGALLSETAEVYASRAEQANVSFVLDVPDTDLTVQGDGTLLQRALANLLDNALKFTPPGGRVQVSARQARGQVVVTVEDNGIGIPQEDLSQLFRRFHRGRNTASYPGSGLGLAIVKAVVEGHGGGIDVQRLGQGTRFTVTLLCNSIE